MYLGERKNKSVQKSSKFRVASFFLAVCLAFAFVATPASANDSDVHVVVGESEIELINTPPTFKIATVPYRIYGKVRSLNQIQVYVNTALTDTIPLSLKSTEFTYDLALDQGEYEIQLVGISPTGSDPAVSFTVKYTATPQDPGTVTPSQPVSTIGRGGTQVQSGEQITEPNPLDGASGPVNSIAKFWNSTLIALDFAKPNDSSMAGAMFARFLLFAAGLMMLIFAPFVLASYRTVRYGWLGWRKGALPAKMRQYPLIFIRVIGVILSLFVVLLL